MASPDPIRPFSEPTDIDRLGAWAADDPRILEGLRLGQRQPVALSPVQMQKV